MRTKEQKKADLLDWMISKCNEENGKSYAVDLLIEVSNRWLEIMINDKANPCVKDVFKGNCGTRILNMIEQYSKEYIGKPLEQIRLSELPHIYVLGKKYTLGKKSVLTYSVIMCTYGFTDKIY